VLSIGPGSFHRPAHRSQLREGPCVQVAGLTLVGVPTLDAFALATPAWEGTLSASRSDAPPSARSTPRFYAREGRTASSASALPAWRFAATRLVADLKRASSECGALRCRRST